MRTTLCLISVLGIGSASPVARAAEPAPEQDVRVVQLQTIFTEAQQRVDRFNATRDGTHLVVARELLTQWLADHRALYGDTPQAEAQRATIVQQIQMIDGELAKLQSPPPPAVAPVPAATPTPQPVDPARLEAERKARAWIGGGGTMLTLGVLTLLGASVPLWAMRDSALRAADEQTFRVDQERHFARAHRRQVGAVATLAVGAPLVALGTSFIAVGMTKRSRARRISLVPQAGPTYGGASLRLRF